MAAKSRVIGARLHPGNEAERAALEIYDAHKKKGNVARDIITNALLKLGGAKVEQFRKQGERHTELDAQLLDVKTDLENIQDGIDAIRQQQDNQLKELLDAMRHLRRTDPEGFRSFANKTDDEDGGELSPTFIANAGKALKPSFRQQHGGDD